MDVRCTYCYPCRREYDRQYYRANSSVLLARKSLNSKLRRRALRCKLWEYLKEHPCVDCGETDPIVLEFDHRDRDTKSFNISDWLGSSRIPSWQRIVSEVDKCDVRCANCHRKKTAKEFGWYAGVVD